MDVKISMNINQLSTAKPCLCTKSTGDKAFAHTFFLSYILSSSFPLLLHLNLDLLRYKIKLDSDEAQYGGHGRLDHNTEFFTEPEPFNGRSNSMQVIYFF